MLKLLQWDRDGASRATEAMRDLRRGLVALVSGLWRVRVGESSQQHSRKKLGTRPKVECSMETMY